MGYFSFKTQDTDTSIPNVNQEIVPTMTVYMVDDKGNRWCEPAYEGYGVFGGKDFFELVAEMNGCTGTPEELRDLGIGLYYGGEEFKSPNLVEDPTNWQYTPNQPDDCPLQGFFYDDGSNDFYDEEDDYDEDDYDEDEDDESFDPYLNDDDDEW